MPTPPFVLQTLVENAFKHGIYPQSAGGIISCVIQATPNGMHVSVTNPGQLPSEEKYLESGLANARGRLNLIYGEKETLDIIQQDPRVITVKRFLAENVK